MRLSPPPHEPARHHLASIDTFPELHWDFTACVGAQLEHAHSAVSERGSNQPPVASVVWYRPSQWPISWAATYATSSVPQSSVSPPEQELPGMATPKS